MNPSLLICFAIVFFLSSITYAAPPRVAELKYVILKKLPHSEHSFTQGLLVDEDYVYESSGLYGKSYLQTYHRLTGVNKLKHNIQTNLFAEGLTLYQKKLYLLTWKAGKLLIFDQATLNLLDTIQYRGEGWGLTHDGKAFVMSNGSSELTFRDSNTFQVLKRLPVKYLSDPVEKINELEFAQNTLWANVWQSTKIIQIHPTSGTVLGIADFDALAKENKADTKFSVLNGIAFDEKEDAFWVTGKNWPYRYLIRFFD